MPQPVGQTTSPPRLIVVMGVSGSGKSTLGKALAEALNLPFIDADHLHPEANVEKMRGGTPLTDTDRWPWLEKVAGEMAAHAAGAVCACSALKRSYRDKLAERAGARILFVLLDGDRRLIAERQSGRPGHFMPSALLDSQFAALEPLAGDENGMVLDISRPVPELVDSVVRRVQRSSTV